MHTRRGRHHKIPPSRVRSSPRQAQPPSSVEDGERHGRQGDLFTIGDRERERESNSGCTDVFNRHDFSGKLGPVRVRVVITTGRDAEKKQAKNIRRPSSAAALRCAGGAAKCLRDVGSDGRPKRKGGADMRGEQVLQLSSPCASIVRHGRGSSTASGSAMSTGAAASAHLVLAAEQLPSSAAALQGVVASASASTTPPPV